MRYIISFQGIEYEVSLKYLHNIIQGSEITAQFTKDSFLRLKDGTTIRMYNADIERYHTEVRNLKIDTILS